MKRSSYLVFSISLFLFTGCGGDKSSSIVVDRDEARELYDSEEYRAREAAAQERAASEPVE